MPNDAPMTMEQMQAAMRRLFTAAGLVRGAGQALNAGDLVTFGDGRTARVAGVPVTLDSHADPNTVTIRRTAAGHDVRFDVLYGTATVRPSIAARVLPDDDGVRGHAAERVVVDDPLPPTPPRLAAVGTRRTITFDNEE